MKETQLNWFKENFVEVLFDETEDTEKCEEMKTLLTNKNEDEVFDIICEVFGVQDAVDMRATARLV